MIQIHRCTQAVRVFGFETRSESNDRHLVVQSVDVQVLVVGLRRAVTARIAGPQADLFRRTVTHVHARRKDDVLHHVVLVHAAADQEVELFAPPLVLEKETRAMGGLLEVAPEAEVFVVQRIVVVLDARRQFRGQEQQFMERVGILGSRHERLVVRSAIGVGLLVRAEITVTVDILRRSIDAHPVAVVRTEPVEFQSAAVDLVIELFGDIGHVGRLVELVAPTAKLVNMVVFRRQTRIGRSFVIGPKSGRLGVEFWDVRESVPVAVIRIAVLNHAEQVDAHFVVVGDERAVERGVEVGRTALKDIGRIGECDGVAQRLLGDDVDHTADGIRPEQRRAASADHLDPLDHGDGQLFKAVDRCQRTEDRAAVEQYLRILPFESVYAQLGRTAVAAVGFDAQSRLEIHRLGQIARGGRFEEFGRGHRYDSR